MLLVLLLGSLTKESFFLPGVIISPNYFQLFHNEFLHCFTRLFQPEISLFIDFISSSNLLFRHISKQSNFENSIRFTQSCLRSLFSSLSKHQSTTLSGYHARGIKLALILHSKALMSFTTCLRVFTLIFFNRMYECFLNFTRDKPIWNIWHIYHQRFYH